MKTFTDMLTEKVQKSIIFDGKNASEVKNFITVRGFSFNEEPNKKLSVEIDGKYVTIFKGDEVKMDGKKMVVEKPIYMREAEDFSNLTRYIPSSSQVIVKMGKKELKITILDTVGTPCVSKDVASASARLTKSIVSFIKDVEREIKLKKSTIHPYVFISVKNDKLVTQQEFTIEVPTLPEAKKLQALVDALSFYTSRPAPLG